MGKAMSYAEKKNKYKMQTILFLRDRFNIDEDSKSVPLKDVKRLLHSASADSFTMVILKELEKEKIVTLVLEGQDGIIYPAEGFQYEVNR